MVLAELDSNAVQSQNMAHRRFDIPRLCASRLSFLSSLIKELDIKESGSGTSTLRHTADRLLHPSSLSATLGVGAGPPERASATAGA
jgi:hypothetical protein